MNRQIKAILRKLGDALFPFTEWIKEREGEKSPFRYTPPKDETPWRQKGGTALSMKSLGTIEFIESLLRDEESTSTLIDLWNARRLDPLALSPHGDPQGWRAARGLESEPRFGIFDAQNNWPGGNILYDGDGNGLSRKAFYEAYFPLLQESVTPVFGPPASWAKLSVELANDSFRGWPSSDLKSSDFIRQFRIDLLHALMSMTNLHVTSEYRDALLVELGEHRRVGDAHERSDVKKATKEFAKAIAIKKPKSKRTKSHEKT